MCGLVGIVGHEPVNQSIYDALTVLQHRGQDAAGIMTDDAGRLRVRKSNGSSATCFKSGTCSSSAVTSVSVTSVTHGR
jgi:amidophosphoribosyltransferase